MIKHFALAAAILSAPLAAQAQQMPHPSMTDRPHATHQEMGRQEMGHQEMGMQDADAQRPSEPGQGAFAAIQEIVTLLDADPATDWSKVDVDRLRRHLVDMSNVTLYATAAGTPVEHGISYDVTGTGAVRESIRRMVSAHAATLNGVGGRTFLAKTNPEGATLIVTSRDGDVRKLRALGFFGILALGAHHQEHHLMIAKGTGPHE